jgi:SAM-dependent methyltransferase
MSEQVIGPGSTSSQQYVHGHHESVLRSHRTRTAANSAAFLLPHLREDMSLLDVGCGPGTITVELAGILASGTVVGVDAAPQALAAARDHARDTRNVRFEQADVYHLPYPDEAFDVVYAHQVLQHLADPIAALREMRRVTKRGGLVAARDSDYASMTWYPLSAGLERWNDLYHQMTRAGGFEPDAGRRLLSWALAAGFDVANVTASASSWCFTSPAERLWWADTWAQRCVASNFAALAKTAGLADDAALESLADSWRIWAGAPDGWFALLHGEVLATV